MNFFCVYVKTRKKMDKYIKVNRVKNKYIIDIKKIIEEEELSPSDDKIYLKILIFQKIQQAIDKKKDIYYIPDFDNDFSIEKLLNLKKIDTEERRKDNGLSEIFEQPFEEEFSGFSGEDDFTISEYYLYNVSNSRTNDQSILFKSSTLPYSSYNPIFSRFILTGPK